PSNSQTRGVATRGDRALASVQNPTELRSWSRLYQILIAPIASHLPTEPGSLITVVPHGLLFQLSFAALLDTRGHYLVERYALNTIPATGLLRYTEKNETAADALPAHYVLLA